MQQIQNLRKNPSSTNSYPEYKPVEKLAVSFMLSLYNRVEGRATQIQAVQCTVYTAKIKKYKLLYHLNVKNCILPFQGGGYADNTDNTVK